MTVKNTLVREVYKSFMNMDQNSQHKQMIHKDNKITKKLKKIYDFNLKIIKLKIIKMMII